jgi:hypothetical protein
VNLGSVGEVETVSRAMLVPYSVLRCLDAAVSPWGSPGTLRIEDDTVQPHANY